MTSSSPPPALILGGGVIAVPAARSLSRSGVRVIALGTGTDPVRRSRCCDSFVDLGAGEGVQDRWLEWLCGPDAPRGVLIPCNDDALELVAHHRAVLADAGQLATEANDEVVLAMLDKHRTYELARAAGVAAPATRLVTAPGDVAEALEALAFPAAAKPRHAHLFQRHFGLGRKIFLARDASELRERLEEMLALGLEMLVTEVIPGPDDAYHSYYSYLDSDGTPLLHLTKRKLRQYPVGFGLATYTHTHRDDEVREAGLRFFERIGLRGMACVEFKRDSRDGLLKIIECNHRLTAGQEVVRAAGIDLTLLVYNRVAGRPDPPLGAYREGVHMWHPVEDARAFVELRRRGELTLGGWLRSLAHRQRFPLFSLRDPRPSLGSIGRFLDPRTWARALRRLSGRRPAPQ